MMRRFGIALVLVSAGVIAGCQPVMSPVGGVIYLGVKGPITATDQAAARKGEACAQSILGLFGTGDASIEAAKANGGIKQVSSVDHQSTNILGIYAKFCTIVNGS